MTRRILRPRQGAIGLAGRAAIRGLAYAWALPITVLGLLCAVVAVVSGGHIQVVDGVLEVHGGLARSLLERVVPLRGGAAALALGHVVLGRDTDCLDRTRSHERVHVQQCEWWGPLFVPAYLGASVVAVLHGGNLYKDNWFERQARAREQRHTMRGRDPDRHRPALPDHSREVPAGLPGRSRLRRLGTSAGRPAFMESGIAP